MKNGKNISGVDIPAAVATLRRMLGETQFGLAMKLGIREQNVQRWEDGKVIPSGDAVLKMLQLCPDRESFRAFGLNVAPDQPRGIGLRTTAPLHRRGGVRRTKSKSAPDSTKERPLRESRE